IEDAVDFVRSKIDFSPQVFILLRGGLSEWTEYLDNRVVIEWGDVPTSIIPRFPKRSIKIISGTYKNISVMCLTGRLHYYEGISMSDVILPVKIASELGIKIYIFTCSAGLVSNKGIIGSIMIVSDYINLMGIDPLLGEVTGERCKMYPVVASAFDISLRKLAVRLAKESESEFFEGIYVARCGPTYETKAEVNFLRMIGADAVGMSLIPETAWAVREGGRVLGLCMITNRAGEQFEGDEVVLDISTLLAKQIFLIINGTLESISEGGLK
ncbi:MAG: purine-nucleoside phosphorylase, partial [bacterium]